MQNKYNIGELHFVCFFASDLELFEEIFQILKILVTAQIGRYKQ